MNSIFEEIQHRIEEEQRRDEIVRCCFYSSIEKAGGVVEITFDEVDNAATSGGLKVYTDHENNKFVVSAIGLEEIRQQETIQQAMVEKESSEVQ